MLYLVYYTKYTKCYSKCFRDIIFFLIFTIILRVGPIIVIIFQVGKLKLCNLLKNTSHSEEMLESGLVSGRLTSESACLTDMRFCLIGTYKERPWIQKSPVFWSLTA